MMTVLHEISNTFNKQANAYERVAKVQQEIGDRLFERLQYLKISPKYILDLGCGPGAYSSKLTKMFPKAHVVGLDLARAMLDKARSKQGFFRKWSLVNANLQKMPFASGTFDLVFSNQVIHWAYPLGPVFRELNRVMNTNGCLMFSTLGPDTFKEIRKAWDGLGTHAHTNDFLDMHDVGDALMSEHFVEPVMDMEILSMHYESLAQLLQSLKDQGVKNIHSQRNKGLTGKNIWNQFEKNYTTLLSESGKFPLSYEVVYGHAWKGEKRKTDKGTETVIPVSQIVRTQSNGKNP